MTRCWSKPDALPGGIAKIYLRGDSALYEHELMRWLDDKAIGYAISADMSPQLSQCIAALPEDHWKLDREETDAIREWAEVNYLPSDGIWKKDAVSPRRYLAIRVRPRQGELLRDGAPFSDVDPIRTWPIERSTRSELVVSLPTANALGLAIPSSIRRGH